MSGMINCLSCFRDGYSKCGLYCTLNICCDQLHCEQEVDIFNAARIVKKNRPQLIPTMVNTFYFHLDCFSLDCFHNTSLTTYFINNCFQICHMWQNKCSLNIVFW